MSRKLMHHHFPCEKCEKRSPGCHGKCDEYNQKVDYIRMERKWEHSEKQDSAEYEYRLKIR